VVPVAGLGTDLARIERFRRLLVQEKRGVIDRLFTEGEKSYALAKKDPASHLAARFAAKEAFLKALGLGLREGISWQEIDVVRFSGNEAFCPSIFPTAMMGIMPLPLSF